ncbi:hypothetical protein [Flavobacterium fluviatile]|uniref:hypothetical protein n=1 Tax=Flavobacterium fluviatile TaxID=1862387 RepID=UPI001FCC98CE|nr:hypothetical protein [Flavobacterium fluviatile]
MKNILIVLSLGGITIGIIEFIMMGLLANIASDIKVSIPVAGYLMRFRIIAANYNFLFAFGFLSG